MSTRAVFRTEVLYNAKRVVPYLLMLLFSGNALLWWAGGPAVSRGWATNGDFYIARLFGGFCFMTMPFFIAVMMADPVIRDFRIGIDPLIFSKPIRRFEYLCGKFFGNFFVLLCCQAAFGFTLFALQPFHTSGMITLPMRVLPYLRHFFVLVFITTLAFAAFCFAIGTLTRSVKIVYGVTAALYGAYAATQIAIKNLPLFWRVVLDPLLFSVNDALLESPSAAIVNRALMIFVAVSCLAIAQLRFPIADGQTRAVPRSSAAMAAAGGGPTFAAIRVELRLIGDERSMVVLLPIAIGVSLLPLIIYKHSAFVVFDTMLLFLAAIAVFFAGEAIHRDRELRVEPMLWTSPVSNAALLGSKFMAVSIVASATAAAVSVAAFAIHPVLLSKFAVIGLALLLPSIAFMVAASMAVHIVCRDKAAGYAVCVAIGTALFFAVTSGHNHWMLNPTLYGLWSPADSLPRLIALRLYTILLTLICLGLCGRFFERKS